MMKKISLILILSIITLMCSSFVFAENQNSTVQTWNNSKQEYQNASDAFKKAFEDWDNVKGMKDKLATGNERLKVIYLASCDLLITQLGHLRTYIEGIDFEEREEIIQAIDNEIAQIEGLKEGITLSETHKDLMEITKIIRTEWTKSKIYIKRYTGLLISARFKGAYDTLIDTLEQFEKGLVQLGEHGYYVDEYLNELNDIMNSMEIIKQQYEEAYEEFKNIYSMDEAERFFRQAHEELVEANNDLITCYKKLKELILEVKEDFKSNE